MASKSGSDPAIASVRKASATVPYELRVRNGLDKVRRVALRMKKPEDMLAVCTSISRELKLLGVRHIRNVMTAIFYPGRKTYMNYEYYVRHRNAIVTEVSYTNHRRHRAFAAKMMKGKGGFFKSRITKHELRDWVAYQKTTNVFIDKYILQSDSLSYYWYSLGPVALGMSTYSPLSQGEMQLFKRFGEVFELVYRRYLDIEKAQAMAREAQIEVAVERVRSKALQMKRPEDLAGVVWTMRQQIDRLRVKGITAATLYLLQDGGKVRLLDLTSVTKSGKGYRFSADFEFSVNAPDTASWLKKMWKAGRQYGILAGTKKEWQESIRWFRKMVGKEYADATRRFVEESVRKQTWHVLAPLSHGKLCLDFVEEPPTEIESIIQKIAKAFDLAYKRFADLQRAEAQAKEARVQTSLERVRASAMAMHSSEDLMDVCEVLYHEFLALGLSEIRNAIININDTANSFINYDYAEVVGKSMNRFSNDVLPFVGKIFTTGQSADDAFSETRLTGKALTAFRKLRKNTGQLDDPRLNRAKGIYFFFYSIGTGVIGISTFAEITDEEKTLLKRFRNVFNLSYQRYADISKAEAQAREAQIEAALERVRSRSMAMHHSGELAGLVGTVFHELTGLGFALTSCIIWIHDDQQQTNTLWIASADVKRPVQPYMIRPFHGGFFSSVVHAWKARDPEWTYGLKGKEKQSFQRAFFEEVPELPDALRQALTQPKEVVFSASFNRFGALEIVETEALTKEKFEILHRFGKVFDMSYTRFADLVKAEAQTREAEIQLALERVRARTMAMHTSGELAEAASELFHQIFDLGLKPVACGVVIVDEAAKTGEVFISADGTVIPDSFVLPYHGEPAQDKIFRSWKMKEPYTIVDLKGERLESHLRFIANNMPVRDMLEASGTSRPDRLALHMIHFKHGFLGINYPEPNETVVPLLIRFAKVFEQTYTRFLDLQQSEAQAREAEIQLALERVRSAAMSMHSSDELSHTITVLFEQLNILGINPINTYLVLYDLPNNRFSFRMTGKGGSQLSEMLTFSFDNMPGFKPALHAWKSGAPVIEVEYLGNDRRKWLDLIEPMNIKLPAENRLRLNDFPNGVYSCSGRHDFGSLGIIKESKATKEERELLVRFAKEFNQTYTRFLDLQKAEAQAREAQIEAALERIRATTMAMHKSDELLQTSQMLFEQFRQLGQHADQLTIGIMNESDGLVEIYATLHGQRLPTVFRHPITDPYVMRNVYNAWKGGKKYMTLELTAKELEAYNRFRNELVGKEMFVTHVTPDEKRVIYASYFSRGMVAFGDRDQPAAETRNILDRFAKVFDQTYTRFLDLQKAEAQAREAQIEAALERLRSRTIGMQRSDELQDAAMLLFRQVIALGVPAFGSGFNIWDADRKFATAWMAGQDRLQPPFKTSTSEDVFLRIYESAQRGEALFVEEQGGEALTKHYEYMTSIAVFRGIADKMAKAGQSFPTFQIIHCAFFSQGYLMFITFEPVPFAYDIFKRFAKGFEQTYTRFLDLQKAEAQAREAEIQLALERVRARTTAMHKSKELEEVAVLLYKEFQALGVRSFLNCGYVEVDEANNTQHGWMTSPDGTFMEKFNLPLTGEPAFEDRYEAWKEQVPVFRQVVGGADLVKHIEVASAHFGSKEVEEVVKTRFTDPTIFYCGNFSKGYLHLVSGNLLTSEEESLLERFTRAFEMTYKRFLDLKKAEAQAREARIEAGLERVRAKAMAMHDSKDISETVDIFFKELKELGIVPLRCGVGEIDRENRTSNVSATTSSSQGESYEVIGKLRLAGHKVLDEIFRHWEQQEEYYPELSGAELTAYYRVMNPQVGFPDYPEDTVQYGSYFYFKDGLVFAWTEKELTPDEVEIFRRFTSVIALAYRRYLDLKEAEAQAREAQIEAALEKVRSRTLAMQKSDELAETAAVLFRQLIGLGIAPNRLYIGITQDQSQEIEFWITDEDGSKVNTMFTGDAGKNVSMKRMYEAWKLHERSMTMKMEGSELADYFHYLGEELHVPFKDGLSQTTRWQYIAFFSMGFIGMAAPEEQPPATITLLERFAYVFNLTFTRFNDLKVAEAHAIQAEKDLEEIRAARKKAEDTLAELQATQRQLIQSEKMASLGELTAGIAHEIQNPLNFVNNFSDVSHELLEELKEAMSRGDGEEAMALAADIRENLQKILYHGKRADGIVKGMLQHSRSSAGQKEATDINALCDEYLRLAYHGLRAKDKSFNAGFTTDFDPDLPGIEVVPQDMGRVLLNLINNAFYAASAKAQATADGECKPQVRLSTKKVEDKVEVKVADNGGGIPEAIKEKIFQPFFTTKPTGEGTGLGLSLSYDIVRAHGGELTLETQEGEGTTFVVSLPVNQ